MARQAVRKGSVWGVMIGVVTWSLSKRLMRLVRWGIFFGVLGFGLSNLWLWSSWGAGMVQDEVERRTGQDWQIEALSWSPWNGLSIYDVQVFQPEELRGAVAEPLIKIEMVRVMPYWQQLWRAKVRPKRVEIYEPHGTVCVEMVAAILSKITHPPSVQKGPLVAAQAVPSELPQVAVRQSTKQSADSPGEKIDQTGMKPVDKVVDQGAVSEPVRPKPVVQEKPVRREAFPLPVKFVVRGAELRLMSIHLEESLVELSGGNFQIDIFGDDSVGSMRVEKLRLIGGETVGGFKQEVMWSAPFLSVLKQNVELCGVEGLMSAQLGIGQTPQGKFPFRVSLRVDEQPLVGVPLTECLAVKLSAERVESLMKMNGYLSRPESWRADGLLKLGKLKVVENHGEHTVSFDQVRFPFVYRSGALAWDGMHCLSENLSLLGNGRASLHDGHMSVTRLVTSPHGAGILYRGILGSGIVQNGEPWWDPTETPDQVMRDLLVFGPLLDPWIDAGKDHQDIRLRKMIDILLRFVRQEMSEKGTTLKALPGEKFKKQL